MVHSAQQLGTPIGTIRRPATVRAALEALAADPSARPVSGGTDLLLELARSGPGPAVSLVDLTSVAGFATIDRRAGRTVLGGGVTHGQVVGDPDLVHDALPLAQACLEVGSPQLRNRATIAGNLVTASPANDTLSALLALGAEVELKRLDPGGDVRTRRVAIDDFFTGFRSTARSPEELVTAIEVPHLGADGAGMFVKLGLRSAQAISVVHLAVVVRRDPTGVVTTARIALGSVGPTVCMAEQAARVLVGRRLTGGVIDEAARVASATIEPIDDGRATAGYRRSTVATVLGRALRAIAAGTQATIWPAAAPSLAANASRGAPTRPAPVARSGGGRREVTPSDPITVTVNGEPVTAAGATRTLLDWLRGSAHHQVGPRSLSGTKEGCAEGECGACTVILDGAAVMSCLVAAAQAEGATVVTVEGVGGPGDGILHRVQQAFVDEFAVQCGYCIPGFIVAAERLLAEVEEPTLEQIRLGLSGNLCRCTGYVAIVDAVRAAARASR